MTRDGVSPSDGEAVGSESVGGNVLVNLEPERTFRRAERFDRGPGAVFLRARQWPR